MIPASPWLHVSGFTPFLSGSYIQYISISLVTCPHMHFWKWNKDWRNVSRDTVARKIYSTADRGIGTNCWWEETASLRYPAARVNILLTQEFLTRVDNSKVCLVSSLTICRVYCGHDASWGAEARMDPPGLGNVASGASSIERWHWKKIFFFIYMRGKGPSS